MKFQYLGTGAAEGWPAIFCNCTACHEAQARGGKNIRRRSGAIIDDCLLIDCSPDLLGARQALEINLSGVKNIIVTHGHEDHLNPSNILFYLPGFAHKTAPGKLNVHGGEYVRTRILTEIPNPSRLKDHVSINVLQPFKDYNIGEYTITPLPAVHACKDAYIYSIAAAGKRILYAHDTGLFQEDVFQWLSKHKSDIVSMDCTNGPTSSSYDGHMGVQENARIKEKLLTIGAADGNTVFISSHFSHNGKMLHEELCEHLAPMGIIAAYDGMTLRV